MKEIKCVNLFIMDSLEQLFFAVRRAGSIRDLISHRFTSSFAILLYLGMALVISLSNFSLFLCEMNIP